MIEEADKILTNIPVFTEERFGASRIQALVRIAHSMFEYYTIIGDHLGQKYFLYIKNNLKPGLVGVISDEAIRPRLRVAFAYEYYRLRYLTDAFDFLDDFEALDDTVYGILAYMLDNHSHRDFSEPLGNEAMIRYADLLKLLVLHIRYGSKVPSAWKEYLDDQIRYWQGTLSPEGLWEGLPLQQALLRLKVMSMNARYFGGPTLAPVHDHYIPLAIAGIPASSDEASIRTLYDALCESISPKGDLQDTFRLGESISSDIRRFTDETPARTENVRLLMRSICIEIEARQLALLRGGITKINNL